MGWIFSGLGGGIGKAGTPVDAAPTVLSVTRVTSSPTTLTSIQYTVTFSESVTGVGTADFTLTTTGSVAGASVTSVSGSGSTYTVTVATGWGNGTIRLDVLDDNSIVDSASQPLDGAYSAGETITITRWLPSDEASLIDWFDASHDASVTTAGGNVSSWATRTASGNAMTTASSYPTHSTANDRVDFNTTGVLIDSSLSAGGAGATNADLSVYVLCAHDKASNGYIFNLDDGDSNPGFGLRYFSPNFHIYADPSGTTGSMTSSAASYNAGDPLLLGGISNGSGASTLAISRNGTLSSFSGTTTRFTATRYYCNKTASTALDYIKEIVIMGSASSTIYRKIEGYLAWKHGITLPSGHAYETFPP